MKEFLTIMTKIKQRYRISTFFFNYYHTPKNPIFVVFRLHFPGYSKASIIIQFSSFDFEAILQPEFPTLNCRGSRHLFYFIFCLSTLNSANPLESATEKRFVQVEKRSEIFCDLMVV